LANEQQEAEEERVGDHPRYAQEKEAGKKFTEQAEKLFAQIPQMQGKTLQWMEVTVAVTWVLLILTILCMLKRPCMLTLSVSLLALYVLHFPHTISRKTFRGLVALLAASWLYDLIWFLIIDASAADEDLEDGGAEYKIRRFTKFVSWIQLLFKLIVVAVYWKDSLDFRSIVRGRAAEAEDDINLIIAQYQNSAGLDFQPQI